MGVTRRIVFPALRLLVWAVIAAALVKLAFAGSALEVEDPLQPVVSVEEPQVEVTTGTVTNTVRVAGSVVADSATPVRATQEGKVTAVHAADGAAVAAGAPLVDITLETPVDPVVRTDPETGEQTVVEQKPKVTRATVTAPIAGTLRLTVLKGQVLAVGDDVGSVLPGTLSVSGTLTPDQQYRLVAPPTEAEVSLQGGPAPFVCTGLRIGAAPASAPGDPGAPPETSTSGTVTCAIPADVTAFPGLGADLVITNGTAEDVLVVPVTAVQGSVQTGNVWVVDADGSHEERAVVLGLTDGAVVQVVEGLAAGDLVLEFVPAAEAPPQDPMSCDPMYGC